MVVRFAFAAAKRCVARGEGRQAQPAKLTAQRIEEGEALAALKVEKAAVEGERRKVEADLGPVRYLATLIGADNETASRWFVLVVALLLDPAAVLLLIAASVRR
jgi:hypothetical protein